MGFFADINNSFKIGQQGYSGRKLTAFASIVIAGYLSINYATPENVLNIVIAWLVLAAVCLGIVTIDQIIRFFRAKNGNDSPIPEQPTPPIP